MSEWARTGENEWTRMADGLPVRLETYGWAFVPCVWAFDTAEQAMDWADRHYRPTGSSRRGPDMTTAPKPNRDGATPTSSVPLLRLPEAPPNGPTAATRGTHRAFRVTPMLAGRHSRTRSRVPPKHVRQVVDETLAAIEARRFAKARAVLAGLLEMFRQTARARRARRKEPIRFPDWRTDDTRPRKIAA